MRYADRPSASVEIRIDAPPERVWEVASDIDLPARHSPEVQAARWVSDGPALGAVFEGSNKHDLVGEWTTTCTVTDYDEGRTFEWTVGEVDNKVARWRFDLAADGDGCLLRYSAEMGPGPSGVSMAIDSMPDREEDIVAGRLDEWARNMSRTLEGIKAEVEAA